MGCLGKMCKENRGLHEEILASINLSMASLLALAVLLEMK
jgi:hypothetical protein